MGGDRTVQLIFTNAADGKDREFNEWYDTVHLRDLLATPGVVSVQRFELCDTESSHAEGADPPAHRYLTIYELEGEVDVIMAKIREAAASGAMEISDSLDVGTVSMSFWSPRGPKVSA